MIDKCFLLTTEFMPQGTLTGTTYDCYQYTQLIYLQQPNLQ